MNNEVCLSWNLFEENIKESLRDLREEQDYFDVTLACEGDFQVDAHKIILSMGSLFFRDIFKKSKDKNTFVFLRGLKQRQLENLMNFLYYGESRMEREDLNDFFKISKELRIKGLESYQEDSEERINPSPIDHSMLEEIETPEDELTNKSDEFAFAFTPELVALEDGSFFGNPEHNEDNNDVSVKDEQISDNTDIDTNVEANIPDDGLTCHICRKPSASKKALSVHITNNHSQLTFDCQICGKSGMKKIIFKSHKRICKDSGLDKNI